MRSLKIAVVAVAVGASSARATTADPRRCTASPDSTPRYECAIVATPGYYDAVLHAAPGHVGSMFVSCAVAGDMPSASGQDVAFRFYSYGDVCTLLVSGGATATIGPAE